MFFYQKVRLTDSLRLDPALGGSMGTRIHPTTNVPSLLSEPPTFQQLPFPTDPTTVQQTGYTTTQFAYLADSTGYGTHQPPHNTDQPEYPGYPDYSCYPDDDEDPESWWTEGQTPRNRDKGKKRADRY